MKEMRILKRILVGVLLLVLAPVLVRASTEEVRYSVDGGVTWVEDSLMDAIYTLYGIDANAQIELLRDITLSDSNWFEGTVIGHANYELTIDGKGFKITRGDGICKMFTVDQAGSTIILKNITVDGGAVWNSENVVLGVNEGLTFDSNAHLFTVYGGSTLVLENKTVLQNSDLGDAFYGAAVSVLNDNGAGTLIMKEGVDIRNNVAASGGAIYIDSDAEFVMEGGKIYNNYAYSDAGGVKCDGECTMENGIIQSNSSGNNGGAVGVNSKFTMNGGSITNNKSEVGAGGVSAFGGVVILNGGAITNNSITGALGGGILVHNGSLSISGSPVVNNNTAAMRANNVYLQNGKTITVIAPLSKGALLGITTKEVPSDTTSVNITGVNEEDYTAYFQSDNKNYSVVIDENMVVQLAKVVMRVPSEPQDFDGVAGYDEVTLTWNEPLDNGGAEIIDYEVSIDGAKSWVSTAGKKSYTFSGLNYGEEYMFLVRAKNVVGHGSSAMIKKTTLIPEFVVNATANQQDMGIVTGSGVYKNGTEVTVTAKAKEGYTFVKWMIGETQVGTDETYKFVVKENTDLVAVFEEHIHVYGDWVIIKAPTVLDTGIREKVCECGHKIVESIPKLEVIPENPSTADNILVWINYSVLFSLSLITMLYFRFRKNN